MFGYEGVTLSDIARRAHASTPAAYSHFVGKDTLLVAASQHELNKISSIRLPDAFGLKCGSQFLHPEFVCTRVLLSELHNAAHRSTGLAALLAGWQRDKKHLLREQASLIPAQVQYGNRVLISVLVIQVSIAPSALAARFECSAIVRASIVVDVLQRQNLIGVAMNFVHQVKSIC